MIKILAAAIVMTVSAAAHADPSWFPIARQCAAQLTANVSCGSCFAFWPEVARCVVAQTTTDIPPTKVDRCIQKVNDKYYNAPQSQDRVADVMNCLSQ